MRDYSRKAAKLWGDFCWQVALGSLCKRPRRCVQSATQTCSILLQPSQVCGLLNTTCISPALFTMAGKATETPKAPASTCEDDDTYAGVIPGIGEAPRHLHDCAQSSKSNSTILAAMLGMARSTAPARALSNTLVPHKPGCSHILSVYQVHSTVLVACQPLADIQSCILARLADCTQPVWYLFLG